MAKTAKKKAPRKRTPRKNKKVTRERATFGVRIGHETVDVDALQLLFTFENLAVQHGLHKRQGKDKNKPTADFLRQAAATLDALTKRTGCTPTEAYMSWIYLYAVVYPMDQEGNVQDGAELTKLRVGDQDVDLTLAVMEMERCEEHYPVKAVIEFAQAMRMCIEDMGVTGITDWDVYVAWLRAPFKMALLKKNFNGRPTSPAGSG